MTQPAVNVTVINKSGCGCLSGCGTVVAIGILLFVPKRGVNPDAAAAQPERDLK